MTATQETRKKYVIYHSGSSLVHMGQDEYEHWEDVSQKDRDWPILKEKYAAVARDLTLRQAQQFCKLARDEEN